MLNETFYLDGEDAKTIGIRLQMALEFSEPVPIFEKEQIPGRNGDLIFETNAFENRTGTASCFCLQEEVVKCLNKANKFLMSKGGYRKLETSDDPEHFWLARVKNGAQIAQRVRTLAPFTIKFDCKPQRFVKSGNDPNIFKKNGVLYNFFGFEAKPLIFVYGTGSGSITVGDKTVEIQKIEEIMCIDSETQNAYNDSGNQNMNINAPEFPTLAYGENEISFSGDIEKLVIFPRWWEL